VIAKPSGVDKRWQRTESPARRAEFPRQSRRKLVERGALCAGYLPMDFCLNALHGLLR
jgi:hypothetical protein